MAVLLDAFEVSTATFFRRAGIVQAVDLFADVFCLLSVSHAELFHETEVDSR
jgi:hypothetical protein